MSRLTSLSPPRALAGPLAAELAREGLEVGVEFEPAFDRRHVNPDRDGGIGGMTLLFWLRGPRGGVTWELLTGCYLPSTQRNWIDALARPGGNKPVAGCVGYHSRRPLGDGRSPATDCLLLDPGVPCYGDQQYLLGAAAYESLVTGGEEALWRFLAHEYRRLAVALAGE